MGLWIAELECGSEPVISIFMFEIGLKILGIIST